MLQIIVFRGRVFFSQFCTDFLNFFRRISVLPYYEVDLGTYERGVQKYLWQFIAVLLITAYIYYINDQRSYHREATDEKASQRCVVISNRLESWSAYFVTTGPMSFVSDDTFME